MTADKAKARIEAFLARDALPELKRMHIARCASDIDEACMPIFAPAFCRARADSRAFAA